MDVDSDSHPRPSSSQSAQSPPHRPEPIVVDDDSVAPSPVEPPPPPSSATETGNASSTSAADEPPNPPVKEKKKIRPTTLPLKPASTAGAKASKAKARSPSPTPPPPPARPPLQTVRLEIKLGGPENYEVDISQLCKAAGLRSETPVPAKRDTSDDSNSEGDDEGDGKPKEKKRRKRNNASDYYDVSDPFIDDSELAQEERTYFAQTKQQGFYVSSGQVALLDAKPPPSKKPKSRKINILKPAASVSAALSSASLPSSLAPLSLNGASTSTSSPGAVQDAAIPVAAAIANGVKPEGSRDAPISLMSDIDEEKISAGGSAVKRKLEGEAGEGNSTASQGKKKRKVVEIRPFHPEIEAGLEQLREAIRKATAESWEQKGKFPPALKPLLAQVALKAVILNEYDDNFFNMMPKLFPYNKFTMLKLIKRTIWRDHVNLLQERQNAILEELRVMAEEGFPKAKEEWEKSVVAWEKRQERLKAGGDANTGGHSADDTPAPTDAANTTPQTASNNLPVPQRDDGGNETGMEHDDAGGHGGSGAGGKGGVNRDAHPPAKRYKLTDRMKERIWDLVCLSNEMCRIENEKNQLENNNTVISDQGARKALYQKIVSVFPEGWLTTGQISRDVSVIKKKSEKEPDE
ncbi:hypothetical protein K474DRAFT_1675275 [Panus rudis PR-1116 ss-1]|nr:hypothetical protein K474DRAFT_1675275 [Panus rudis PR-1116 ss-1]